jgi:transposase-like protein
MSKRRDRRPRRAFTPEFKAEAVALVRQSGKTVGQVAKDLDLTATALRAWVTAADERGRGGRAMLSIDERAELKRLREENRILRMERDFAKKAAVFFAKEST